MRKHETEELQKEAEMCSDKISIKLGLFSSMHLILIDILLISTLYFQPYNFNLFHCMVYSFNRFIRNSIVGNLFNVANM